MISSKNLFMRHLIVGTLAALLALPFWFGRLDWDPEMRFWRAVGDSSFLLLCFTLAIGPLTKVAPSLARLLPWRREAGIWYGLFAFLHTFTILNGWVRWDAPRFFGYEFIPQLGRQARIEPGFGLANIVGMIAVLLTLTLVATSSKRAIDLLGPSAWKWLQYSAYTVFYLVALHTFYFLFIHYTESFHRSVPPDANWFRYPFLVLAIAIPLLQFGAFVKTVARKTAVRQPQVAIAPRRRPGSS